MVIISKEEATAIRERYGDDAHISIVNRHKRNGRKKYYLPEEGRLISFLNRFRNRKAAGTRKER